MPKRSRTKPLRRAEKHLKKKLARAVSKVHNLERDENQSAFDALQHVIELSEGTGGKDPLAVALGRRGGLKGGPARAAKLTKSQLKASAEKAARARWAKKP